VKIYQGLASGGELDSLTLCGNLANIETFGEAKPFLEDGELTRHVGGWRNRSWSSGIRWWCVPVAEVLSTAAASKTPRHRLGARSLDTLKASSTVVVGVAITFALAKRKRTRWKEVISNICQSVSFVGLVAVVLRGYTRTSASWDGLSTITFEAYQITKAL